MTDATTTEAPAKPRRKQARRKQARKAAAPSGPKDEFAGLTATACCTACTAEKCLISGTNVCAHPLKGGLQTTLMQNRPALERYNRAKKMLAHQKIDLTKG